MQRLKSWPRWQLAWFLAVLAGFWLARAQFSYENGNHEFFHTDASTEHMTIVAAQHYVKDGFFKNYLLPTYPPFGNDPEGKPRTEEFVYSHYLAGQDLVLGVMMKFLGDNSIWLSRLVPLSLTVLGLFWLGLEFATFTGATVLAPIFVSLMMIPRSLTVWSICIYGHSHVMAFYLIMVAAMFWMANRSGGRPRDAWIIGILTGIGQMFFDLDWVPLTFFACASLVCLLSPRLSWAQGRRLLVAMVVGGLIAGIYQLIVSTLYFGSLGWVVKNLQQWLVWRAGHAATEGIDPVDLQPHRIWQEFDRQTYGATGLTAMNLICLSILFIVLGYLSKLRTKAESWRTFAGLFLAWVSAVCWSITMRQHALAHVRFISRHYFVLYLTFLLIALPVCLELVRATRKQHEVAGHPKRPDRSNLELESLSEGLTGKS